MLRSTLDRLAKRVVEAAQEVSALWRDYTTLQKFVKSATVHLAIKSLGLSKPEQEDYWEVLWAAADAYALCMDNHGDIILDSQWLTREVWDAYVATLNRLEPQTIEED